MSNSPSSRFNPEIILTLLHSCARGLSDMVDRCSIKYFLSALLTLATNHIMILLAFRKKGQYFLFKMRGGIIQKAIEGVHQLNYIIKRAVSLPFRYSYSFFFFYSVTDFL